MIIQVKTDLTTEPVSTTEAKLWCKVSGTAEDSIFTILISAARKALERYTSASFGVKTIYATWDEVPQDWILLVPYGPIIAISRVYRIDNEGSETLLSVNTDYWVTEAGNVKLAEHWSTGYKKKDAYRVEYTAGYGDTTTESLPADLKLAIMKQVATDYIFRENVQTGSSTNICNDSKSLAAPYRRNAWFY